MLRITARLFALRKFHNGLTNDRKFVGFYDNIWMAWEFLKRQLGGYWYVCAEKRGLWRRLSNVFGCSGNWGRESRGTDKHDKGKVFLEKMSLQTTVHTFVPTEGPVWFNWYFSYLTFSYLLTPWSTVLLEKLTGFQLVKKFPTFYVTRRFITGFISAGHLSLS
jgi:hypothetical protein